MKRFIPLLSAALTIASVAPSWAATDPYRVRQWGFDRIRADQAWAGSKGAGVTIAIVDTGIDLTHPDLKGKIASAYTCAGGTCAPGGDDDNGHGSHVAGIAAATTGNGVGVAGVAPSAKLMAVKVLDAEGGGACSDIELSIRWAADRGADVINLSLGAEIYDPLGLCALETGADYAWAKGAVVVISAGNEGLFSFYSTDYLLVVGATRSDDSPSSNSNAGANIYAPGGQSALRACDWTRCVFSTWKDGGYRAEKGTSMAVPHVSGVAALLLARGYTNAQARARILSTADDVDGFPRVNAARAVGVVAGTKTVKPKPPSGSGSGSGGSTRPGSTTSPSNTDPRSTTGPAPSGANHLTPMPVASPSLAGMSPQAFADSSPPTPASRRPILASVAGGMVLLVGAGLLGRRLRSH